MALNNCVFEGPIAWAETRKTDKNEPVFHFILALDRNYEKNGEKPTDWPEYYAYGNAGKFLAAYAKVGDTVTLRGALRTNSWKSIDGKKHKDTSVFVDEVTRLQSKAVKTEAKADKPAPAAPADDFVSAGGDVPFQYA